MQRPRRAVYGLAPKDRVRLALIDYNGGSPRLQRSFKVGRLSRFPGSHGAYERALCEVISSQRIGVPSGACAASRITAVRATSPQPVPLEAVIQSMIAGPRPVTTMLPG